MHSFGISTIVPVAFDFVAVDNVPNLAALLLGELDVDGSHNVFQVLDRGRTNDGCSYT